jgi:hypothetical protein
LTIVEFNSESLIINGTPGAINCFSFALALGGALLSGGFVPVEQLRSIDLFLGEGELVVGRHDLDLIRKLMGAKLVRLKQINCVHLRVDMEVPCTEDIVLEAMHWLISSNRIKRVEVIKKAGDGQ